MSETRWKKKIENFNINVKGNGMQEKIINTNILLSPDVGKQYDSFLSENENVMNDEDYNLNVFNRKIINIYNKKNNYNKKDLLPDLYYDIEEVDNNDVLPSTTEDAIDMANNDNIEGFQEGFKSPLCNKVSDDIYSDTKNRVQNYINYPFFIEDRVIQFFTDFTCGLFVSLPPSLINIVQNVTTDISGLDISGVLNSISNINLTDDASGNNIEVNKDDQQSTLELTNNLIQNLSPEDLNVISSTTVSSARDAFMNDISGHSFYDCNGDLDFTKWTDYVNSKSPDNKLVKKYISNFFLVLLCWFITYNWFFLFYYLKDGKRIKTPEISRNRLANFNSLLDYIFGCLITPVVWLDALVMHFVPDFILTIPIISKPYLLWILTYISVTYFITNYGSVLQGLLNKCLFYDYTEKQEYPYDLFFSALYVIVFYSFVKGVVDLFVNNQQAIMAPIATTICKLIQFIIIMLLVPISGILPVFYIFIYSFFAMFILNNYRVSECINDMQDYIFKDLHREEFIKANLCTPDDDCLHQTIFMKILKMLKTLSTIFYNYIIEIILIMMFLSAITDYTVNMQSADLKAGMVILTVIMIGLIIFFATYKNFSNIYMNSGLNAKDAIDIENKINNRVNCS